MRPIQRFASTAVLAGFLAACENASEPASVPAGTFDRIRSDIFGSTCIGCHTAGNTFAAQSGLVLDGDGAHDHLVHAQPKQPAALGDGLLRVVPGDPQHSLLYRKLLGWTVQDFPYGSPMPLGGPPPTLGEVEYVRQWILAGAPEIGVVADARLLLDRTPVVGGSFVPPVPPQNGVQLVLEPFAIQPKFERELFLYRAVGNADTLFVNRFEVRMRVNSHHFVLYTFHEDTPPERIPPADLIRDIRNPDGSMNHANMLAMGYHVFFGGSMTPSGDYALPPGVALRLPPGAHVDLNSHYVNGGEVPIFGEVYANLHTIPRDDVVHVARTLNLSNFGIQLPPTTRTTLSQNFTFGAETRVVVLTSHMHKRGERFVIRIVGGSRHGEMVYETEDWAAPAVVTYDPPIVLVAGEGLRSEVTWYNDTDHVITFGLTSEDEMGIIFGYAY